MSTNFILVLTLPAFEWIQVDASHKSARFGHTCHVVGNSQLLSIGGADPNQSDPWSTIDSAFQGLGVFDLNGWNWTTKYNANAATYKRAGALDDLYESKYVIHFLSIRTMSPSLINLSLVERILRPGICRNCETL